MLNNKFKYLLISICLILFNNNIECQDHLDVYFSSFMPYFDGDSKETSNLLVNPKKLDPLTLELSVYNVSLNKYISNNFYPGFEFGIKYLRKIKSRIHLTGGIGLKAYYNDFLEFQDSYEFKSKIYSRIITKSDIHSLFVLDTQYFRKFV